MRIGDRLFKRMGEVRNGDQKVRKYLFPEIFYGRQEVHKYFCTSVNINGRFTFTLVHYSRLLHVKKSTDRPTVAAPKCQPSEDEPPDHSTCKKNVFINGIHGDLFGYQRAT